MLRRCYQAELLKNRHTAAEKLAVWMPAAVVFLAAVLTMDYVIIDSYNWWYIGTFPGCTALTCSMVLGKERRQKNRNILSLPIDMRKVWDSKVLYGIRQLAVSVFLLSGAAFCVWMLYTRVFHMKIVSGITPERQLAAALILFITGLWQVPFCLLLQQLFGSAAMPLIHVAGYGITAAAVSLKPYFMLLPGAIPARLMCSILHILPNGLLARPGSMTYSPELMEYRWIPVGIISSLIWFFVLWGISRRYFEKKVVE